MASGRPGEGEPGGRSSSGSCERPGPTRSRPLRIDLTHPVAGAPPPAIGQAPQPACGHGTCRRPCQMRRCDSIVPSRRGNSEPTSASTLTGYVSDVFQPNRRASRPKCSSTVMPGTVRRCFPSTTLAVLCPIPGGPTRSVEPARHLPAVALDEPGGHALQRGRLGPRSRWTRSSPRARTGRRPRGHRRRVLGEQWFGRRC